MKNLKIIATSDKLFQWFRFNSLAAGIF